jgi:hypothetical protein
MHDSALPGSHTLPQPPQGPSSQHLNLLSLQKALPAMSKEIQDHSDLWTLQPLVQVEVLISRDLCDTRCQGMRTHKIPQTYSKFAWTSCHLSVCCEEEEQVCMPQPPATQIWLSLFWAPQNTPARLSTKLILNWHTLPPWLSPTLVSTQEATSTPFALNCQQGDFWTSKTLEFEHGPWGDLSKEEVFAESLCIIKCQDVCSLYLETDCFSTFLTPTFQCVISEDKCTLWFHNRNCISPSCHL